MSSLLADNLHALELAPGQLVVFVPPFYSMAIVLALVGGFPTLVFVYFFLHEDFFSRFIVSAVCLLIWVAIWLLAAHSTQIVLSRPNDTLTVQGQVFGLRLRPKSYPLHDVDNFYLYTARGHSLEVSFKSGRQISLTKSVTNQAGYSSVVHAMNRFLAES